MPVNNNKLTRRTKTENELHIKSKYPLSNNNTPTKTIISNNINQNQQQTKPNKNKYNSSNYLPLKQSLGSPYLVRQLSHPKIENNAKLLQPPQQVMPATKQDTVKSSSGKPVFGGISATKLIGSKAVSTDNVCERISSSNSRHEENGNLKACIYLSDNGP